MPNRKTLFETGTISNVDANVRLTDKHIVDAMFAVEEKRKKAIKEAKSKTEGGATEAEKFHDANYYCPVCNVAIDRRDSGLLQEHHSKCSYRQEWENKIKQEKQARYDGLQKMRHILHQLLQADVDIARLEKKMQDPTIPSGEKKYLIRPELEEAKATKRRELVEKHKLLNHENEITRNAAQEVYDEYLKMTTENERRRAYHIF